MKCQHPFLNLEVAIPDDQKDNVASIKQWLNFQPHLPSTTDETILLFLHSCYYSLERTKDTLEAYYSMRAACPAFFADWHLDNLSRAWQISEMFACPKLTEDGYRILTYRLKDFDYANINFDQQVKAFCAFNDVQISQDGLVNGYIVILDARGVTLGHFMKVAPCVQSIRCVLLYLQECHPVRLKQVHVINTVQFMDKILALAKPFIQSELMDILHLHGNSETLSDYFNVNYLPQEYGGKQLSGQKLSECDYEVIRSQYQDWLKARELMVANEKCRREKPRKEIASTIQSDLEGSFRKLEFD